MIDNSRKNWTNEEKNLLLEHSQTSLQEMLTLLPHRSRVSIKKQMLKLGIQEARITTEFVRQDMLKEDYELLSEYTNSRVKLQTLCPIKHQWSVRWNDWQQGHRCGFCSPRYNVNTETVRSTLQKEGFELVGEYQNASIPIMAACLQGHTTSFRWHRWLQKPTCTECGNRPTITYEKICSILSMENYKILSKEYINAQTHLQIQCPKGCSYPVTWTNWQQGHRCPVHSFGRVSRTEKQLADIYKEMAPKENNRSVLNGKELDLYFPTQKVAIEYCGLFWHSDVAPGDRITSSYHRSKLDLCTKQNIHLLTVFEDEWLNHKDICISRINSALGIIKDKVFARKCTVKQISNKGAYEFLTQTHLQGSGRCKIAYGLFYNNKLVQVMTFGSPNRAHTSKGKRVLEMKRLAGELNTIIIGGASKLFKLGLQYAKDNNYEIIKSYCDLRWGTGNLYQKLGFVKTEETKYVMHYTDGVKRWRNQTLATNKILEKKSETNKAFEKGLWKIFDCGHQTWEYEVEI